MTRQRAMAGVALTAALLATGGMQAAAEVVLDGTVGSRGKLTLNGRDVRITPDMGSTRGGNLFHSFEKFGVPKGDAVTFEGPGDVQRVIGRVTGPQSTQIHGTLRSTMPNASVWLLNPNGVVVGKNATIDVPGALRLSTADELRFEDGSTFSARDVAGSSLTAANPRAFGFLGGPIGTLSVEAPSLEAGSVDLSNFRPGSLALVGGQVSIQGTQVNVAGPVLIAAQVSAGEVPLVGVTTARDGKVTIGKGASVSSVLLAGSTMRIEGGDFTLDHATILPFSVVAPDDPAAATIGLELAAKSVVLKGDGAADTQIGSNAFLGNAPYIAVTADQVTVENAGIASSPLFGAAAGNVTIVANRVSLSKGAIVGTPAVTGSSGGAGGQTTIVARDNLSMTTGAQINSITSSDANGGDIVLSVGDFTVSNGSISTSNLPNKGVGGAGAAGSIVVLAAGKVSISTAP